MSPSSNISRACVDGAPPPSPPLPRPSRRLTLPDKLLPLNCSPATTMISKTTVVSITVITLFRKVQIGTPPSDTHTHTHTPSLPRGEGGGRTGGSDGSTRSEKSAGRRRDERGRVHGVAAALPGRSRSSAGGQSEAMVVKPECRENRSAGRTGAPAEPECREIQRRREKNRSILKTGFLRLADAADEGRDDIIVS